MKKLSKTILSLTMVGLCSIGYSMNAQADLANQYRLNHLTELLKRHADTLQQSDQQRLTLLTDIYTRSKNLLGESHASSIVALNDVINFYNSIYSTGAKNPKYPTDIQKELLNIIPLADQAYRLASASMGETHPYTASALNNLVLMYGKVGRISDAKNLAQSALNLSIYAYGQKHPETLKASAILNLANNSSEQHNAFLNPKQANITLGSLNIGQEINANLSNSTKAFRTLGGDYKKGSSKTSEMLSRTERRVALVIGNNDYKHVPKLKNAKNDADDMAKKLKSLGFDVFDCKAIGKPNCQNLTHSEMKQVVKLYGDMVQNNYDIALFYYSGHGIQIDGKNYLIPTDMEFKNDKDIFNANALDVQNELMNSLSETRSRVNIVILDACRNNPLNAKALSGQVEKLDQKLQLTSIDANKNTRALGQSKSGLSRIRPTSGTIVAFSTSPDSIADDGEQRNGLYTKHLLATIGQPNLSLEQIFKRVRENVRKESQGIQVPHEDNALEGEDFYFVKQG